MRPGDAQHLLGALSGAESPVGFAVFDEQHRFLAVNATLAARSGRSVAEHLGKPVADVLPPLLAAHTSAMIDRVISDGQPFETEEPVLGDDEGLGRLRSSWYLVGDPRSREIAMFVVDDTTHRLAIDALQHSRARNYRLLGIADRFAVAVTVDDVVQAVADVGAEVVGARWSSLIAAAEGPLADRHGSTIGGGQLHGGVPDPTVNEVIRTGWPIFLPSRSDARASTDDPRAQAAIDRGDEEAWAVLPVTGRHGPVGALRFTYDEPQAFASESRRFLRAIAQQCSNALSRATLYDQERTATASLSRGLRPPRLPQVTGLELQARSTSTSGDEMVGGDWYDAFVLPNGALGLVVGDVMGHGLQAAAGMGQIRAALRALALAGKDPGEVLSGLDLLVESGDIVDLATVVYAVVDPETGRASASGAGHLPLAHVPLERDVELIDAGSGSTPLGVSQARTSRPMRLRPGDLVLGFTDGLVESRDRGLEEGFDRLIAYVSVRRTEALDRLLDGLLEHMIGDERGDDITVFALRWSGPATDDHRPIP